MEVTLNISKAHNITPFELFREDTEEVILLINHYVLKADNQEEKPKHQLGKEERIRVNDKTASGGWF